MPPRKRSLSEISHLSEPQLSAVQAARFREGIDLFNRGKYWEAHEAWEDVWKTLTNRPEDDGEIILRGLIQFTAGMHGLSGGKRKRGRPNLQKALEKLKLHSGHFLSVDLEEIVDSIQRSLPETQELLAFRIRSYGNDDE